MLWRYIFDWSSNLLSIGIIVIFIFDLEVVNSDFFGYDVGGFVVYVAFDVFDVLVLSRGGLAVFILSIYIFWIINF